MRRVTKEMVFQSGDECMASAVTSVSRACLAARGQADPIEASVLDSQTRLLVLAGVLGALEDLDTA